MNNTTNLTGEAASSCHVVVAEDRFSSAPEAFAHHMQAHGEGLQPAREPADAWTLFISHAQPVSLHLAQRWLQTVLQGGSARAGGFVRMHRPVWDAAVSEEEREECMRAPEPARCLLQAPDVCRLLAEATRRAPPEGLGCLRLLATPAASFAVSRAWIRRALPALARLPRQPFLLRRVWESLGPVPSEGPLAFAALLQRHFGGALSPSSAPRLHPRDLVAPGGRPLRLFIYELPAAAHAEPLGASLRRMQQGGTGCGPGLGPCQVLEGDAAAVWGGAVALGHMVEAMVLAKLLRAAEVPGALTADPWEADLLVVPWLCSLSVGQRNGLGRPLSAFAGQLPFLAEPRLRGKHLLVCSTEAVLPALTYAAEDLGDPRPGADPWTRALLSDAAVFRLDLGARNPGDARHLIMPHSVWDPRFHSVPAVIGGGQELPVDGQPRDVLVFACVGLRDGSNRFGRERNRIVRMLLGMRDAPWGEPAPRDGGVDIVLLPLADALDWEEVHRRMASAVFCPSPPGDNADATPRFYHAVAAGCIPVMFAHASLHGGTSWHSNDGALFEDVMPFSDTIDYEKLVVQVPASVRDPKALYNFLTSVTEEEIRAKQAYGATVGGLLAYDFSGSAPDMLSAVLRQTAAVNLGTQ